MESKNRNEMLESLDFGRIIYSNLISIRSQTFYYLTVVLNFIHSDWFSRALLRRKNVSSMRHNNTTTLPQQFYCFFIALTLIQKYKRAHSNMMARLMRLTGLRPMDFERYANVLTEYWLATRQNISEINESTFTADNDFIALFFLRRSRWQCGNYAVLLNEIVAFKSKANPNEKKKWLSKHDTMWLCLKFNVQVFFAYNFDSIRNISRDYHCYV